MDSIRRVVSKRIGEILLEARVIDVAQLDEALEVQSREGGLIGSILVRLGFAKEADIVEAFALQYGIPYLPLENYRINPDVIQFIPYEMAKTHCLIPVDKIQNVLTITMAHPLLTDVIEEIERAKGCLVQTFVSTESDIYRAIERMYTDRSGPKA